MPDIEIEACRVVRVEPGDVIVYKVPFRVTPEHRDLILEQLRRVFPDNKVVVVDAGCELAVMRDA